MPAIILISRHTPETCPMNSEQAKKMVLEITKKLPELAKKYQVKVVGTWAVMPEHMSYTVFEADNYDAYLKFSMEPLVLKWIANTTSEIKIAITTEEAAKLLQ
jgi:hypothetical protein